MNEHIQRLEEKIAFLEHHVTEQDKVMLEMNEDLARMRRELLRMAVRLDSVAPAGGAGGADIPDERPPHY